MMSKLEDKLQDVRWFLKKLSLFSRPVLFQIVMGLTVLYVGRVYLDFLSYRIITSTFKAVINAVVFFLQHRGIPFMGAFYAIWLIHWFYLWRMIKKNCVYVYSQIVCERILIGTIIIVVLLSGFSLEFRPDQF